MNNSKIMILGTKESFLIRAMEKKLEGAGYDSEFVTWDVNDISTHWTGTDMVTLYMDEGEQIPDGIVHFLVDKMADEDKKMITIGSREDNQYIFDHVPGDLIHKSFTRPMDNDEYVSAVGELISLVKSGAMKKTILVVDDDPSYLNLVRGWLKGDYKVAMANSGLQAIKWLGRNKADLILLDYEMPVTSGPQVLEMLRNDAETASIPVMFLTGKGDKESVLGVMSLNPQGYFLKSIERNKLLSELENFFIKNK